MKLRDRSSLNLLFTLKECFRKEHAMKNEKKIDIEQANKVYFQSLANTRASASMMLISFAGVFVLLLR